MSKEQIDVRYVAKLARLDLTEDEAETFQSQLESIISHVESLTAVELPDDLEDTSNNLLAKMRNDEPHQSLLPEQMLQNAPDQSQAQIRVPKVVADA